jgi:hypothetical protein
MLMEVLSTKPLWKFLGNHSDSTEYFLSVCNFLNHILKGCKAHDALLTSALSIILRSRLFTIMSHTSDLDYDQLKLCRQDKTFLDIVGELIELVLKVSPVFFPELLPFVFSAIHNCFGFSSTGKFLKSVVQHLSVAGNLSPEKMSRSWKMLPTILDEKELLGELMEADQKLPHVKSNEPYLTGIVKPIKTLNDYQWHK